jgi:hypothetical protein
MVSQKTLYAGTPMSQAKILSCTLTAKKYVKVGFSKPISTAEPL